METLEFIEQFGLLGEANGLKCGEVSKLLYKAFLNKFDIQLDPESYEIMNFYHQKVYDMIDCLRSDSNKLKQVLTVVDQKDPALADIIIMSWLLPRSQQTMSQVVYNQRYKENIKKYGSVLIDLIDFYVVKNFCTDSD